MIIFNVAFWTLSWQPIATGSVFFDAWYYVTKLCSALATDGQNDITASDGVINTKLTALLLKWKKFPVTLTL